MSIIKTFTSTRSARWAVCGIDGLRCDPSYALIEMNYIYGRRTRIYCKDFLGKKLHHVFGWHISSCKAFNNTGYDDGRDDSDVVVLETELTLQEIEKAIAEKIKERLL